MCVLNFSFILETLWYQARRQSCQLCVHMCMHVHVCMCVCDMYMYGILTVMGNCWKSLIVMSHFGHATSLKCSLLPSFPSTFPVGNTWLILRCFDILMIHMHAHGIRTEGTVSYPLVPVSFYGFVYFFPLWRSVLLYCVIVFVIDCLYMLILYIYMQHVYWNTILIY